MAVQGKDCIEKEMSNQIKELKKLNPKLLGELFSLMAMKIHYKMLGYDTEHINAAIEVINQKIQSDNA